MPNYYSNPYQYPYQNVPQTTQGQPQIQSGGFVPALNEDFARNYPVARGNSVSFKDENLPYVYVKTVGFSQFDAPTFEKYRLVKEEVEETPAQDIAPISDAISDIKDEIALLWTEIEDIKNVPKKATTRRKDDGGDA